MNEHANPDEVAGGVRRVVGVAALRRLRALVDAERAQDAANARALPKVVVFIGAVVVVLVVLPLLLRWLGPLFR